MSAQPRQQGQNNTIFTPTTKGLLKRGIDLYMDRDSRMDKYGDINSWDVRNVKDMSYLFEDNVDFNENINNWDVSNVKSMYGMFSKISNFNQPLDNWNVSNVISMYGMFESASAFNQPLNNWNVSNVNDMSSMFEEATAFNQSLDNWNVSNETTVYGMFDGATSYTYGPLQLANRPRSGRRRTREEYEEEDIPIDKITMEIVSLLNGSPIDINPKATNYECPICFEEIGKNSEYYAAEGCHNYYHKQCLQDWCKDKRPCRCPMCRREIRFPKIPTTKGGKKRRTRKNKIKKSSRKNRISRKR